MSEKSAPGSRKFTPDADLPRVDIICHGDLFAVPESCESRNALFDHFAFGSFNVNLLILSPFEVFFLTMLNSHINIVFDRQQLWDHCCSLFPPTVFAKHYAVYHYYRCNLWVVRDGSVFAAHFVLYPDHPDLVHSKFMVIVMENWEDRDRESLRASRIGWSVRKTVLLVRVVIPEGTDFSNPDCLSTFTIEDVSLKRVKLK
jgi:tRNA-splicing endonuclease subunit Sen2